MSLRTPNFGMGSSVVLRRLNLIRVIRGAAALAIGLCSSVEAANVPAGVHSDFALLIGKLRGSGVAHDTQHGDRTLNFDGNGVAIPGGLRLTYDVTFSDGERQHKVWTILAVGPDRFIGRRDDVIGDAQIVANKDLVQIDYKARVATRTGATTLSFDEQMKRTGAQTFQTTVSAKFLFIKVGGAQMTIRNEGPCASSTRC